MIVDIWQRMDRPSATEILAIRSILDSRDMIVNAQPSIVSIPIMQLVYSVSLTMASTAKYNTLAGHVKSIYTDPYPRSNSRASLGH